ncbi:UNVERIFIED_CONTAM: hypothetical protein GTU68_038488 [Idotea baltica]|nr:hypothetical protein [Idotea baltica]
MKPNKGLLLIAVIALLLIGLVLQDSGDGGVTAGVDDNIEAANSTEVSADESASADEPASTVATSQRFSDLPLIAEDLLPIEAIDTLDLIFDGGPYPFDRDDLIFQNREGLLPDRERGHYREYTVITPGESDRGARRIVAGADGELYYTQDHYESFLEIELG